MDAFAQSLADVTLANGLTRFSVTYVGERFGPQHRFSATAHFEDAALGQIPCASGDGPTIAAATEATLNRVRVCRTVELVGEEALYGEAA